MKLVLVLSSCGHRAWRNIPKYVRAWPRELGPCKDCEPVLDLWDEQAWTRFCLERRHVQ